MTLQNGTFEQLATSTTKAYLEKVKHAVKIVHVQDTFLYEYFFMTVFSMSDREGMATQASIEKLSGDSDSCEVV